MPHSDLSFRALSVLHTSRYLFNKYGFHKVGVDRIIESSKTPKATFYNYFHSKERLIEMSLTFQKDGLKHEVLSIINVQKDLTVIALYTTNFTEPLSYQGSAFLKLPKFP